MSFDNVRDVIREHYTNVIDQCFSEDGSQVVALDAYGRFITFSSPHTANSPFNSAFWKIPRVTPLCLDTLTGSNYLTAGDGGGRLHFFAWASISESATRSTTKPSALECSKFADSEINDVLALSNQKAGQNVVVGCGDGSIRLCDIELKKVILSFDGHSEQVNKLAARRRKQGAGSEAQGSDFEFASCSNDGTLHLWDVRAGKRPARTLRVAKNPKVSRANFTRGVYTLDVDDDFVVCGGGVALGLWHIGSESLISKLTESPSTPPDSSQAEDELSDVPLIYSAVEMMNGQIAAGGRGADADGTRLQRFDYTGGHVLSVPLHGIHAIRTIRSARPPATRRAKAAAGIGGLTLVGGESPDIFCLNEQGFLSHTINVARAQALDENHLGAMSSFAGRIDQTEVRVQ